MKQARASGCSSRPFRYGRKMGNVAVPARPQDFPVAQIEQRIAAQLSHPWPPRMGFDKPFEGAGGCRAGVGHDEVAGPRPWPSTAATDPSVTGVRVAELIEAPCAGDDADQAFVGRAEAEGHGGTIRVTRLKSWSSGGKPGFGRRLPRNRASDGQGLRAAAEQSRVSAEPERIERCRRPAAKALVDQARRGHVADLEAGLARQTEAQIVLAEERAVGALKRVRLIRVEPRDQRQRLARELRIVAEFGRAGFGPVGAPAL